MDTMIMPVIFIYLVLFYWSYDNYPDRRHKTIADEEFANPSKSISIDMVRNYVFFVSLTALQNKLVFPVKCAKITTLQLDKNVKTQSAGFCCMMQRQN
ncbi:hypothetical protein THRCLA_20462 [Thraustotheca clavata]|uniref:Uncharacterized protein n=1 Tax=Thraustotheca clavata TaxID=74557 RepID=A0A1W0A7N6_9STRA|nr:hypothetical protein THRCLA_20462 [Thraustotheca clavata]